MLLSSEYRKLFSEIRESAKESIDLCGKSNEYRPGIKYLTDHFLFDLSIYRNLRIVKFLADNIPKNSKVLDWGCGYGDASFMLKSLRPDLDITSYDVLSSPPWEVLSKKENLQKVFDNNEEKLPFENQYFDAILGIGVLEHVKDQKNSLFEICRILKPGREFYVFLYPNKLSYTERFQKTIGHPHHDKPMTMEELRSLLSANGFSVKSSGYEFMLPFMLSRFPFEIRYFYNLFASAIVFLNDILEKIPTLNKLSSNLTVIAQKKKEF